LSLVYAGSFRAARREVDSRAVWVIASEADKDKKDPEGVAHAWAEQHGLAGTSE
jgi:hypothetical protein